MATTKIVNANVDGVTDLWLPDPALCSAQEEFRRVSEWRRSAGGTMRPSQLGIEKYRYGPVLHQKFYEGRNPPPVPLDSAENLEWYAEQLHRCIHGFEYKGTRISGDHYWSLNFVPFLVAIKDKDGNPTTDFDIDFPYFSYQHDYIFKLIEEAHSLGKGFMLMGGRGFGKTYGILSILSKLYYLKPNSYNIVSASHSGHANGAFIKMKAMLRAIDKAHPTLALSRITDTKYSIQSGYEITKDGVKYELGPMSRLQCVIYGDNPGVTRGERPDSQLLEEVGDWATGKGDLKSCIGASDGSWRVGTINKCRVFMVGTGGSIASDQAKDIFLNPDAYNLIAVDDFRIETNKKHAIFIPSDYLLGGMGWERTGVNDNVGSRKFLEDRREVTKDDIEIYDKQVQEFPLTIAETFKRSGTNIFNQRKISKQWTDIQFAAPHIMKVERGMLEWTRTPSGKIVGVEWQANPRGNIDIIEHPYHGKTKDKVFNDLYIAGVDSIDQGLLDSTSTKNRSSLSCLIKKRIVDGEYFSQSSNMYVAKYLGRSLDVRDDYEDVLKLVMYYSAKVNIEYSKIGIVSYFREKKQWHRFMKRPIVAQSAAGDGDLKRLGIESKNQFLIGTTTAPNVIDHQDGKIKEYINDYCHLIFFPDLLEQLRDYQREDRKKYDLVVAMGLCEIADEDMLGMPAREHVSETQEFRPFGYYRDERGIMQYGILPAAKIEDPVFEQRKMGFSWIDSTGVPRFDRNYDILDARELLTDQL
jgi:hypothetical protein